MTEPTIVVTDAPEQRDGDVIAQGLAAYNTDRVGPTDWRLLGVLVKDGDGNTAGSAGNPRSGSCSSIWSICRRGCAAAGSAAACWQWRRRRGDGAAAARPCSTR